MIFALTACSEPEKEALDLKDIIDYSDGDTDREQEGKESDSTAEYVQLFKKGGLEFDSVKPKEKKLFPDRFGPDSVETYTLFRGSYEFSYHHWTYSDSLKVTNAFFNWIDCFGEGCKSFYVGETRNFQKDGFIILVGTEHLIYVEGGNLNLPEWLTFHELRGMGKDWQIVIEQKERGRANWHRVIDGKKEKWEQ